METSITMEVPEGVKPPPVTSLPPLVFSEEFH